MGRALAEQRAVALETGLLCKVCVRVSWKPGGQALGVCGGGHCL